LSTDLITYGPILIPYRKAVAGTAKHIDNDHKKSFLNTLEKAGLGGKQGCYIFALRAAKGHTPWYIGKATKSMRQECMSNHPIGHYNAVLFDGHKGTPVLFFISPRGAKNKVPKAICDDVETFLIQNAYSANPKLRNIQKTKVPEWNIAGIMRSGKGKATAQSRKAKKMFGL
jgi:hypothetical protein